MVSYLGGKVKSSEGRPRDLFMESKPMNFVLFLGGVPWGVWDQSQYSQIGLKVTCNGDN